MIIRAGRACGPEVVLGPMGFSYNGIDYEQFLHGYLLERTAHLFLYRLGHLLNYRQYCLEELFDHS